MRGTIKILGPTMAENSFYGVSENRPEFFKPAILSSTCLGRLISARLSLPPGGDSLQCHDSARQTLLGPPPTSQRILSTKQVYQHAQPSGWSHELRVCDLTWPLLENISKIISALNKCISPCHSSVSKIALCT